MPVAQLTLSEAQAAIANLWGTDWATMAGTISEYGLTPAEMASNEFLYQWSGGAVTPIYAKNGETILGYNFRATPTSNNIGSGINSNTAIVTRGTVNHAPATTIETIGANAGKVKVSRLSGVGTKVVTAASKIAVPLTLASIGITLGKTIDEALYNFNPNFWDSVGLSTLNPQTWSSIAGGDGTLGGDFINALFGIDPQTGETQAYISDEALAYMAYCMNEAGVFAQSSGIIQPTDKSGMIDPNRNIPDPIPSGATQIYRGGLVSQQSASVSTCVPVGYMWGGGSDKTSASIFWYGTEPFTVYDSVRETTYTAVSRTYQGNTYYICSTGYFYNRTTDSICTPSIQSSTARTSVQDYDFDMAYLIFNGTPVSAIPGIGDQTGATTPNFNGLSESDYLPYLQQTYPNMFNNAINYPVVQPNGTVKNHTYVPITLPDTNSTTNTQPVSGDQTQAQPSVNPSTATQTLTDLLQKILTQPMTQPITDTRTPPDNPVDTGDGSSPVPIVPVGSASALWKIYHPTQAQIDSFGSWLWSSNFIDQILKIFNNPMEAVIGLHKVYATPIDAGTANIKVGYLDSGVSSAYIEQQYINVSCGSINLYEQFGNVLDYSPFTDVQLYLPFVGIVPLNVADVMRSTISVTYGVDVITGACLAQVEVSRDGNSSVLYQYSGNCAVQYPISSGSYMGIVTSIISVAGGVAATAASGGAAAPLALGAAGGLLGAHTSVQHSGGFSGNAGAMGGKIPYLIVTRPQSKIALGDESMNGYPANHYVTVGECSGYIKANKAHIINVNATDEELTEINDLLLNGIII